MIYHLCDDCSAKEYDRNAAAVKANPDKSLDWWVSYWEKAELRQLAQMRKHCYKDSPRP